LIAFIMHRLDIQLPVWKGFSFF